MPVASRERQRAEHALTCTHAPVADARGSASALAARLGMIEIMDLPLVEELTGLDAWDACRRLAGLPRLFFLDSAQESAHGRYSYVSADPFAWVWPPSGVINDMPIVLPPADPFACLADGLDQYRAETIPELPPFQGGAAGLFPYDLCHYLERLPRPRYYDFALPDLAVGLYDWVVAFDRHEKRAWLVSTGFPEVESRRRRQRARARRDQVRRILDGEPRSFPRLLSLRSRLPRRTTASRD